MCSFIKNNQFRLSTQFSNYKKEETKKKITTEGKQPDGMAVQLFVERRNKWTSAFGRDLQYALNVADFLSIARIYLSSFPSLTDGVLLPHKMHHQSLLRIKTVGKKGCCVEITNAPSLFSKLAELSEIGIM